MIILVVGLIFLPQTGKSERRGDAINDQGKAIDLTVFLKIAENLQSTYEIQESQISEPDTEGKAPPCLEYFTKHKISQGCRNEVMYNFAVYYKRKYPDTWEERVYEINYNNSEKPLPKKEMSAIISSIAKKNYNYKCFGPIGSHCDRIQCQSLQFGIKAINQNYSEMMIGGLSKIMTDPPRWLLEINGIEIELSTEEIMNYKAVRTACMERIDLIAPPMKSEEWLQQLQERMSNKRIISAPKDASEHGQILQCFFEFIQFAERAKDKKDILRGIPVKTTFKSKPVIIFRSNDVAAYLKRKKVAYSINNNKLWSILRNQGCSYTKVRINGSPIRLWYLPIEENEQKASKLEPHDEQVEI